MNRKTLSGSTIWSSLLVMMLIFAGLGSAQDVDALPLAEAGSYMVASREMTFIDETREMREIEITVWYPAEVNEINAAPDVSGAPYPLVLYSHGHTGTRQELHYLTEHLTSHSFVVVAMSHPGDTSFPPIESVDRPMDVLFVLEQLASADIGDLNGVIDTEHTGVAGYSEGGFTTLELTGAQLDLEYEETEWCAMHPNAYPRLCIGMENFAQIRDYRAQFEPPIVEGEPWSAYYDERIKAALPLAGGPGPLFGEAGLAAATVPTLLMAGTADRDAPYEWAAVYVYENLGSDERYLISLIGAEHWFGYRAASPIVLQFATAFFGYYLRGQEEYTQYLTEDYVNSVEGLAWGVYSEDE